MMTQDMGSVLQQALMSRQQPGGDMATTQTMEPVMEENFGPEPESFQPEEIAEQLEAVKALMEQSQDPEELAQLKTVAEQLTLALESLSAALPQQVQGGGDPTMGQPKFGGDLF